MEETNFQIQPAQALEDAIASGKRVVGYFKTNDCAVCKHFEPSLKKAIDGHNGFNKDRPDQQLEVIAVNVVEAYASMPFATSC